MRIPRIYDPKLEPLSGSSLTLDDFGAHHVAKVLRLKPGAALTVFDGRGHEFEATLTAVGKQTTVKLGQEIPRSTESPLQLELLQVVSRGDRMDFTIQKAVELGISRILPLTSERCGVKLDAERAAKKIDSFQKIAIAACEQCGRNVVPPVAPLQSLSDFLRTQPTEDGFINLTLDPRAQAKLTALPATGRYRILIGPEGGFTPEEVAATAAAGFVGVTLGPRILRTETAALVTLSILGAHFGDL